MKWKDTGDAENKANEEEEGYLEEAYSPLKSRKFNWFALPGKLSFWIAGGAALLAIVLVIIFAGGNGDMGQRDALEKRLALLENRQELLDQLEDRLEELEKDRSALEPLLKRLEHLESEMASKLPEMSDRIGQLQKQIAAAPVKKDSATGGAAKYHVIQKGETLYSISKKYGLTVEALRRANELSKNAVIQPGQRLLLK